MKWGKVSLIIIGAVFVTALGLDAADTLSGNQGTLLGQLIGSQSEESICPQGMLVINAPTTFTCVDLYEASVPNDCEVTGDTKAVLAAGCGAASRSDAAPWTMITREEAMLACAQAGKRLPDAKEWYQFAIGTPDSKEACNTVGGQLQVAGSNLGCVSAAGVYDAVGNVWEWTTEDVFDQVLLHRPLPEDGYVSSVDSSGIALTTETRAPAEFGRDYIFTDSTGAYGLLRGGFYGSRDDAGVYAIQATIPTTFRGEAVGFRCVQ